MSHFGPWIEAGMDIWDEWLTGASVQIIKHKYAKCAGHRDMWYSFYQNPVFRKPQKYSRPREVSFINFVWRNIPGPGMFLLDPYPSSQRNIKLQNDPLTVVSIMAIKTMAKTCPRIILMSGDEGWTSSIYLLHIFGEWLYFPAVFHYFLPGENL